MLARMVFRLLRASLLQPIHWVSQPITDGVVARIMRRRGNLAGVRQLVALELSLPPKITCVITRLFVRTLDLASRK